MSGDLAIAHSTGGTRHQARYLLPAVVGVFIPPGGLGILFVVWWFGGWLIANDDDLSAFADFAPGPTFAALVDLIGSGDLSDSILSSLYRVGTGLLWGFAIGVPIGILIGYLTIAMRIANVPFQFLRMISPLAWMPIAVLAFETWDSAIIFLIVMATVWPIMFSTSHGVKRIDPDWFKVVKEPGCFWHSNGAYYYSPGNHGRRDGWRPVGCRGRLGGLGPSGIPRSNKRARLCNQRRSRHPSL